VHTTFHGSITGWKQEPAAEEMHHVAWVLFCEIYTLKAEVFFWGSETGISSFWKRSRFSEEIKDLASTQKSKIKESTKPLDLH